MSLAARSDIRALPWFRRAITAIVLPLALMACGATDTINRAGSFAAAGIAYTDAVPAFYDHTFEQAVTSGSIELEKTRPVLDTQERLKELRDQDRVLEERLSHLAALKQRTLLLRSYFLAIKGLADADDAPGITDTTKNVVDRLASVKPGFSDLKIAGTPAKDLIGPATTLIVGAYKASALRREFVERGVVIERELALQRAVLEFLRDQSKADLEVQIQVDERGPLERSFITGAALPSSWRTQRITMFRRTAAIPVADTAVTAAETMHQSWIALVRGNLDGLSIGVLIKDVENFIALIEAVRSKK